MTAKTSTNLFASLPRRGRAGALLVAFWAALTLAFVVEVAPARAPEERLYDLYASADAYARSAAAARRRAELAEAERGAAVPPLLARVGPVGAPAPGAFPAESRDCSCP